MAALRLPLGRPCHYCFEKVADTRDHIIPRSAGGPNEAWNVVLACAACNTAKGSDWPECRCIQCLTAVSIYSRRIEAQTA